MIEIDGSQGEAGGQILRTALSFSCILQKPVKFLNIRSKRPKPGLQAQHLTCVKALKEICNAEVKGAQIGSQVLEFIPSKIKSGDYFLDIGTAGSITLLAQCILPVLLFAEGRSRVEFAGGTHVAFSPTADYFSDVFLPSIARMGVKAEFVVRRFGWFPVGGGKATLEVTPIEKLLGLNLTERKSRKPELEVRSFYSRLPVSVGQRQAESVAKLLTGFDLERKIEEKQALCPGSSAMIVADYGNCVAGFSSLGAKGKPAETVGEEAAQAFLNFDKSKACIDEHLADQLLLYCALCKEKSVFTVEKVSQHFETNVWVISKFLEKRVKVENNNVIFQL